MKHPLNRFLAFWLRSSVKHPLNVFSAGISIWLFTIVSSALLKFSILPFISLSISIVILKYVSGNPSICIPYYSVKEK